MKLYKKINICAILLFIFIILLNLLNTEVYAEELPRKTFYLTDKGSLNGVLFTDDEVVSPGNKLIKEFYVANDNDFKCILKNIVIDGQLFTKEGESISKNEAEYKSFMDNVKLGVYYENKKLFNGNADGFLDIDLSKNKSITIDGRDKKKFRIEFVLDKAANNSTMNKKYIFNIHANFTLSEESEDGRLVQTGYLLDEKVLIIAGAVFLIIGCKVVIKSRYN